MNLCWNKAGLTPLREYNYDQPLSISGSQTFLVDSLINWWNNASAPMSSYVWVWQEKGKGTTPSDTVLGSTHGGWKFNDYWRGPSGNMPSNMDSTPDSVLQNFPFFSVGSTQNGPPDQDLRDENYGSTYAQANRNRILSDAVPATSWAIGSHPVQKLNPQNGDDRNFNLTGPTFQNGWPDARLNSGEHNNNWYHSDFVYIAYPFTSKFFAKITEIGNLKKP